MYIYFYVYGGGLCHTCMLQDIKRSGDKYIFIVPCRLNVGDKLIETITTYLQRYCNYAGIKTLR